MGRDSVWNVDFELPGDDDPRRQTVRAWLADYPRPSGRVLAEAGYVVPHWPKPWGHDADPIHQLIIDEELRRAKVGRPVNPIGIGWAGPTILHGGTQAQKDRYLMPLLSGEEFWCQLFSEPGAGSDLANLGTRAVRDGDVYVVNGQKIWTTMAHFSKFGILIARTNADAPKHKGVSYFICPMDLPGITIRPIIDMTGVHAFNEVFFDEVRLPAENLVGDENEGWGLAKVTLGNERVSLSGEGALWGRGPTAGDLLDVVRARGGVRDPMLRQRLTQLYMDAEVLRLIRLRTVTAAVQGKQPGPEASVRKALADEHGQHIMGLAKDLAGTAGMLASEGPLGEPAGEWAAGYLFAPALTVGGGTSEVQRNIIAERVLGLPHDIDVELGKTWSEARTTRV
jgi:alkylation response protein AidB-like acyl-CoA dehydrogenase